MLGGAANRDDSYTSPLATPTYSYPRLTTHTHFLSAPVSSVAAYVFFISLKTWKEASCLSLILIEVSVNAHAGSDEMPVPYSLGLQSIRVALLCSALLCSILQVHAQVLRRPESLL